jgi:hypothetical protein
MCIFCKRVLRNGTAISYNASISSIKHLRTLKQRLPEIFILKNFFVFRLFLRGSEGTKHPEGDMTHS